MKVMKVSGPTEQHVVQFKEHDTLLFDLTSLSQEQYDQLIAAKPEYGGIARVKAQPVDDILIPPEDNKMFAPEWRRYRKKPVVVRAYQTPYRQMIVTLEGEMVAQPGDFIVEGVARELYPCRGDIFRATYEEVE